MSVSLRWALREPAHIKRNVPHDSLFNINLVQNDEKELYDLKQSSQKRIDEMRQELVQKEQNIEKLKSDKNMLLEKKLSKQVKETAKQIPG